MFREAQALIHQAPPLHIKTAITLLDLTTAIALTHSLTHKFLRRCAVLSQVLSPPRGHEHKGPRTRCRDALRPLGAFRPLARLEPARARHWHSQARGGECAVPIEGALDGLPSSAAVRRPSPRASPPPFTHTLRRCPPRPYRCAHTLCCTLSPSACTLSSPLRDPSETCCPSLPYASRSELASAKMNDQEVHAQINQVCCRGLVRLVAILSRDLASVVSWCGEPRQHKTDAHAGHLVLSYHRWCSSFIRRPRRRPMRSS